MDATFDLSVCDDLFPVIGPATFCPLGPGVAPNQPMLSLAMEVNLDSEHSTKVVVIVERIM